MTSATFPGMSWVIEKISIDKTTRLKSAAPRRLSMYIATDSQATVVSRRSSHIIGLVLNP